MVQQRQWRHSHIDAHYAAAIFRYMREYALELREYCAFICLDDKHKLKVGEPNCPVAAVKRGRGVPVRANQFLTVADHDFTKFGLVPSVVLVNDIPEEISGSWYRGQVHVLLKDTVFEPSSPFRHACELYNVLQSSSVSKSVLFLYADGGPDHRLTLCVCTALLGLSILKDGPRLPLCRSNCTVSLMAKPGRESNVSIEFGATMCWLGQRENAKGV